MLVSGTFVAASAVLAVNATGAFELDGNPTTNHAIAPAPDQNPLLPGAPDDWDRVCHQVTITNDAAATPPNVIPDQCASSTNTNGATAVSWIDAQGSLDIFTGGGSKDPQDIEPSWLWKPKDTVPDKDTLLHGYAARYSLTPNATTCPAGAFPKCEVIFFGSDRFDNSGDSQQGFWFFQNKIGLTQTASQGGFKFSGVHKPGDLLIISQFSNGGTTSTIQVYFWDPTCKKAASNDPQPEQCGAANLLLKASSTAASCATSNPQAGFCGIVNTSDGTTTPWSFTDKSGNHTYLAGEFYEGGINLSTLGIANECFASIASETRSSTSPTATLKDFVLGNFGKCETTVVTTPKDSAGNSIPAAGLSITTAGSIQVKDSAVLTVSGTSSFTGTLDFHLCKVDTGNCATGGTPINLAGNPPGTNAVTANGTYSSALATITSAGRYCWRANFTSGTSNVPDAADPKPTGDTTTTECFLVVPVQPTISTNATATVVLGNPIDDTATLGGTAKQPNGTAAGGTITFSLYGPSATAVCTDPATGVPGNRIATSVVTVTGDSAPAATPPIVYKASNGTVTGTLTPTAVGTYYWIAAYSGNSPNTLSVSGACGNTGETTTVTGSSSLATAQDWLPNDTATLTGDANLNGKLNFTLYNDATCGAGTGTAQYTEPEITVTNKASGSTFSTNNTTVKATTTGSWSWKVKYVDNALTSPAVSCKEVTSLTINNNTP